MHNFSPLNFMVLFFFFFVTGFSRDLNNSLIRGLHIDLEISGFMGLHIDLEIRDLNNKK